MSITWLKRVYNENSKKENMKTGYKAVISAGCSQEI